MKTYKPPLFVPLIVICILMLSFSGLLSFKTAAQNCVNPNVQGPGFAFPQGREINVHVNSGPNQFTPTDIACLQTAFNNWNTANGNNWSGVHFTVTASTTPVVTTDGNGHVSSATADYVYQVNRSTEAVTGVGVTGGQTATTAQSSERVNAFTNIHPNVTNCTALTQTMAHEIGHVMGLGECSGCSAAGQSVMMPAGCLQYNSTGQCISLDYNNTTLGLSGPTSCDNNVVHTNQQYRCTNHNPANCEGLGYEWDEQSCMCITCYCNSAEHYSWCSDEEMRCTNDGRIFEWCLGYCTYYSPIVVDVAGNGFNLSDAANGVFFDINHDGLPERISWTSSSDDAWLALDRDGDGQISNGEELFGNFTPQPEPTNNEEKNGFRALSEFDHPQNGGNGDGVISNADSIFNSLRLWHDNNHNGVSEPSELKMMVEDGLAQLDLDYKESKRTDAFGNRFRYRAKVKDIKHSEVARWAWDVFLLRGR
jgi:hypothetical protein